MFKCWVWCMAWKIPLINTEVLITGHTVCCHRDSCGGDNGDKNCQPDGIFFHCGCVILWWCKPWLKQFCQPVNHITSISTHCHLVYWSHVATEIWVNTGLSNGLLPNGPSHYLNQCWLIISKIQWHSSEGNFTRDAPYYVIILSMYSLYIRWINDFWFWFINH